MKILIVEDQPDIRAILQDFLELNGHEVLAAEDGVEGVKLAAQRPEFIFCDVTMPNLDGRGVLKAIKQMPELAEVPFVFLTANADRADQREGMALGADDYITKPFTEKDLVDAIAARTKRQLSVRERIQQFTEHHKREINAHWSHELLTPLNAVIGSLELLETASGTMSPAELKEMLGLIREGATRQERLARKLIRYFSLEQMRQAPASVPTGRCDVAPAVNAGAAKAARETNRAASLQVAVAPAQVAVDDASLQGAIYEVVVNALTFSPRSTAVKVAGQIREGNYRITLDDEGIGMTAEQCAQVGPFTQFDRKKHEQQGLGLGLAIAQLTAKCAGGALLLEPGAGGRGLRVIFSLPLGND
jgi:two-component system sensor histidine kinase/response regulator